MKDKELRYALYSGSILDTDYKNNPYVPYKTRRILDPYVETHDVEIRVKDLEDEIRALYRLLGIERKSVDILRKGTKEVDIIR